MAQARPRFGIDAPGVVLALALLGLGLAAAGLLLAALGRPELAGLGLGPGLSMGLSGLLMLASSRCGKPWALRRMVRRLALRGDEQLLDVGCGRGMLLLEAARRLPRGRATGLDLWSTRDQSGNAAAATARNAELAGLRGRVRIDTGDMRAMPYPDASFDVVVSSLAIHNLPGAADREQALREIARVLRPGGRLALLDFLHTGAYARALRRQGLQVRRSWPVPLMFPPVWIVRGSRPG
ncbi:class I SAM-dependent methyltransferase [Fulvimonas soli]|jgi:SAM-dependent methyltransferase|uniref:Methyltransferase family protein n=1 Tax=Fulvimonas soli TaxID=155197 RepID=A0A316HMT1_9GAMM|nr:class I SAM-dependent methyltransferase [Fulvimonas soli]PWK81351.1 methyltransferase family protein [Fulvimonas soli]TNY26679.1 hypothetical protein BV497_07400 [Fulvimonas soli]